MRITEKWFNDEKPSAADPKRVVIPLTVYGRDGKRVTDLMADEIEIYEDGIKQELLNYGIYIEPMTTVVLFDISPSTFHREKAIRKILKKLSGRASASNRIIIGAFDHNFKFISERLTSTEGFDKIIKKFKKVGSGTSIYDAVTKFCRVFVPRIAGRKAIIVFSDGVDTTSRGSTYASSVRAVQLSNVIISGIY